ncbi:MAG: hypothetical protein Q9179_003680 [Wetmoreana sp. 5 TL-2023]
MTNVSTSAPRKLGPAPPVLRQEKDNKDPQDDAPSRIPPESTLARKSRLKRREAEGDDEVETPSRGRRERHAYVTDMHWESFCGIGEGNRTHSWGVEAFETGKDLVVMIIAVRGTLLEVSSPDRGGSMKKDMPVHRRKNARKGNVKINNGLLPNLSIVKKAGNAKTQFRMPVPIDARSAEFKL